MWLEECSFGGPLCCMSTTQWKQLVNPVHRRWRGEVLQLVSLTSSSGWWPPVVDLSVVIIHGWLLGLQRQQLSQRECGGAYLAGGTWLWSDERRSLPAHPSGYEGKVSPQLSWLPLPGRIKCERHSIWLFEEMKSISFSCWSLIAYIIYIYGCAG